MTRFELFWRTLWLALRRSPSDKQALKAVLWLAWVVAYLAYLIWTLTYLGLWGSLVWGVILGLAIGLAVLIARNNAHSSRSLISLSNYANPAQQEFNAHRPQIVSLLLRNAVLTDRAGAEILHIDSQIAEHHIGLSRRRTLDIAQRPALWLLFSEEDRNLLLSPEGSWDTQTINTHTALIEDVRVLRWVIQLDSVLIPFEFLKADLMPALEITTKPNILEGETCTAPWDLRPARDIAQEVLQRCIAEGMQRGIFTVDDEDIRAAYLEVYERTPDFYLGTKTVAQTSEIQIRSIAQAAIRRATLLDQLINYLGGDSRDSIQTKVEAR